MCIFLLFALFYSLFRAEAMGPHELVVIANDKSAASMEIARKFVRMRGVPEGNLITVSVPVLAPDQPSEMSHEEFTSLIWEPVTKQIQDSGIGDHVLAWIYSTDIPLAIITEPRISIQGITFLRNKLPEPDVINRGGYVSALYSGPVSPADKVNMSQTFDVYKTWLGSEMPLPSMILGSTLKYGSTKKQIIKCIENGIASDGTRPKGTVYFVAGDDIRSDKREWQFTAVGTRLLNAGVKYVVTNSFPTNVSDVIGIMAGAPYVPVDAIGGYLPGAMAEHFTSWAGVLCNNEQTKLTAWLNSGATASAGMICEPYAMWPKFPNASFFADYAAGCTMIESFFQAVRSPIQIIIVGEPLACPWGRKADLTVAALDQRKLSGKVKLITKITAKEDISFSRFVCYVDGVTAAEGMEPELDTTRFKKGVHKVRVVGYSTGLVKNQAWIEKEVEFTNE